MKKLILLAATSVLLTALPAWADDFTPEKPAVKNNDRVEWSWDGGERARIGVPATVRYQPGGAPRVIVTGPADILAHVEFDHGELRLDDAWRHAFSGHSNQRLDVTLSGMTLKDVSVAGSGDIHMGDIHQDRLRLAIAGSGSFDASGKVDTLDLHIAGSGRGHLEKLDSVSLNAHIAGSGRMDVGKAEHASFDIAGSGDVHFQDAMPNDMSTHIAGSGRITDGTGRVIDGRWRSEARERRRDDRER